jgi:hypothetical protein
MRQKLFDLHDTLISQGFRDEANEIIKLAKANLVEDIILEAEENIAKSHSSEWKTKISKTQPISNYEIKSLLLSLGCNEIEQRGREGGHDKFSTDIIFRVKSFLEDSENRKLIPSSAVEYFIHTLKQVEPQINFFMVQRGSGSYVPPTSLLSNFWKFIKCLATAKILLERYIVVAAKKDNSQSRFNRSDLFQLLLERKKGLEDRIIWATLPESGQNEDDIISLMEQEAEVEKEIQDFWTNP